MIKKSYVDITSPSGVFFVGLFFVNFRVSHEFGIFLRGWVCPLLGDWAALFMAPKQLWANTSPSPRIPQL